MLGFLLEVLGRVKLEPPDECDDWCCGSGLYSTQNGSFVRVLTE